MRLAVRRSRVELRPDGLHFTGAGSRVLERWMFRRLEGGA